MFPGIRGDRRPVFVGNASRPLEGAIDQPDLARALSGKACHDGSCSSTGAQHGDRSRIGAPIRFRVAQTLNEAIAVVVEAGERAILLDDDGIDRADASGELVNAIEEIRRGGRYLGARRTGHAPAPGRGAELAHDALSDREYQVLRMLGSGNTVSEIAVALSLSVKTVSTYRIRLLEKLHMRSNAELMRYAIENRLVDS